MGLLNTYEVDARVTVTVEASSEQEARQKAGERLVNLRTMFTVVSATRMTDYR